MQRFVRNKNAGLRPKRSSNYSYIQDLTEPQLQLLTASFERNKYPCQKDITVLGKHLCLSDRIIKIWFHEERLRAAPKDKHSNTYSSVDPPVRNLVSTETRNKPLIIKRQRMTEVLPNRAPLRFVPISPPVPIETKGPVQNGTCGINLPEMKKQPKIVIKEVSRIEDFYTDAQAQAPVPVIVRSRTRAPNIVTVVGPKQFIKIASYEETIFDRDITDAGGSPTKVKGKSEEDKGRAQKSSRKMSRMNTKARIPTKRGRPRRKSQATVSSPSANSEAEKECERGLTSQRAVVSPSDVQDNDTVSKKIEHCHWEVKDDTVDNCAAFMRASTCVCKDAPMNEQTRSTYVDINNNHTNSQVTAPQVDHKLQIPFPPLEFGPLGVLRNDGTFTGLTRPSTITGDFLAEFSERL